MKFATYLALILSLFVGTSVSAAIHASATEYVVAKNERITENIYVSASSIMFSGVATQDVTLIGNDIVFNGIVQGDLLIIGKDVEVTGKVTGDIKIAAARITIADSVGGDVVLLGGETYIADSTKVGGDALLLGGTVNTYGSFIGDVSIVTGKTNLNGAFAKDVTLSAQNVTIGDVVLTNKAMIDYFAPYPATITGDESTLSLNYNQTDSWKENGIIKHSFLIFISFWTVLRFVTTVIIIFLFIYGLRKFTRSFAIQVTEKPFKNALIGLGVLVGIPFISLMLIISLVGLPIGIIFGLLYATLFVLRYALMSIVIGAFIKRNAGWDSGDGIVNFWYSVAGLVVLTVVQFIPYVGQIISVAATLIAFGAIALVLTRPLISLRK